MPSRNWPWQTNAGHLHLLLLARRGNQFPTSTLPQPTSLLEPRLDASSSQKTCRHLHIATFEIFNQLLDQSSALEFVLAAPLREPQNGTCSAAKKRYPHLWQIWIITKLELRSSREASVRSWHPSSYAPGTIRDSQTATAFNSTSPSLSKGNNAVRRNPFRFVLRTGLGYNVQ